MNEITQQVIKNLDSIEEICKNTLEEWNTKTVPLVFLKELIKNTKIKTPKGSGLTRKERNQVKQYTKDYNTCMQNIYDFCEERAKQMLAEGVPLRVISLAVQTSKEGIYEGMKEPTKEENV